MKFSKLALIAFKLSFKYELEKNVEEVPRSLYFCELMPGHLLIARIVAGLQYGTNSKPCFLDNMYLFTLNEIKTQKIFAYHFNE